MQLVIKNGKVIATHEDSQNIAGLYPGCEVVLYQGALPTSDPRVALADDPRTNVEKVNAYLDKRRNEYPSIQDQLDMMYWDAVNKTKTWTDAIAAVKAKHSKPTQAEIDAAIVKDKLPKS